MSWISIVLGLLVVAPVPVFVRIAFNEFRRFQMLQRSGISTSGEIIGETPRRIGEAPSPIIRFKDEQGLTHEFRSQYPRRTKAYSQIEKVMVLYLGSAPTFAEIDSFPRMLRWCFGRLIFAIGLCATGVVLMVASNK